MSRFSAVALATACNGKWLGAAAESITSFHFDSREVAPGTCFVALKTGNRDGHDFIAAAHAKGAAAALVSQAQPNLPLPQLCVADTLSALHAIAAAQREAFTRPLTAITGSFGKTSTKEMLSCMLGEAVTATTPGNWNNHIGLPLSLLRIDPCRHRFAVIEAGISTPGEMPLLARLAKASHVLFTGIGPAHLEALGSEARVAAEKFALAEHAATAAMLFFPYQCLQFEPFRQCQQACHVLVKKGVEVKAAHLPKNARILHFTTRPQGRAQSMVTLREENQLLIEFTLASASEGMASNAALAAATALTMDVEPAAIITGAANWQADAKRGRWHTDTHGIPWFVDCYNANPIAMRDALNTFLKASASADQARLFVLGTMLELGPQASALHQQALRGFDFKKGDQFLLVGDEDLRQAYASALQQLGVSLKAIRQSKRTADALPLATSDFSAVFLKGSRCHQLEKLTYAHFGQTPKNCNS